ncbi:hypothetical protein Hanom_Chr16g01432971 [Helianthus anomalus]
MDSKTGESSSSAQASADALYCKWGIWNPVLPSKTDTTFPLKKGKITLFSDFFKFCNFRLAITKFCKLVLDHYPIHISQLHPFGLVKLRQFEFAYIALGHIPRLIVFRAFFVLVWKSPFFYLQQEGHRCREMGPKDKVTDDGPLKDAYMANALYTRLCGCPFECTVIHEGALVMAGMSLLWRDIKLYPSFQRDDEGEWSLFDFVDPPPHATLKVADRMIGEQEPDVLKIHLEQFLLPVVSANPAAYVSHPSPSGVSSVSAAEAK